MSLSHYSSTIIDSFSNYEILINSILIFNYFLKYNHRTALSKPSHVVPLDTGRFLLEVHKLIKVEYLDKPFS